MLIITSQRKIISLEKKSFILNAIFNPCQLVFIITLRLSALFFENTCYVAKRDIRWKQAMIYLIIDTCKTP